MAHHEGQRRAPRGHLSPACCGLELGLDRQSHQKKYVGISSGWLVSILINNCCADLEERIAELEATTARKGNRKVSLTVSGWVAEQVLWWDDGAARGTYVGGIGTTLATNVKFTGQATIMPGWYAGYVLHWKRMSTIPLATVRATRTLAAAQWQLLGSAMELQRVFAGERSPDLLVHQERPPGQGQYWSAVIGG